MVGEITLLVKQNSKVLQLGIITVISNTATISIWAEETTKTITFLLKVTILIWPEETKTIIIIVHKI